MKIADTDIDRFIVAQDNAYSGYAQALSEIRKGKKTSHWIWYIFPQFREFGHSSTALYYGIADREEAYRYLTNPMLRERLYEITNALLEHKGKDIVSIFGELDAKKVRSCMTMFDCLSPNDVFGEVLDCFYNGVRGGRTLKVMGFEAKAPLAIKYTPEKITSLKSNEVFVFGSNLEGHHGGGAARFAYNKFGAIWGLGVGLQGQSYAIPTMHGGVEVIKPYVDEFIAFALKRTDLIFYVTKVGCGIAGFEISEMAPLFAEARNISNIILPQEFVAEYEKKDSNVIGWDKDSFIREYESLMMKLKKGDGDSYYQIKVLRSKEYRNTIELINQGYYYTEDKDKVILPDASDMIHNTIFYDKEFTVYDISAKYETRVDVVNADCLAIAIDLKKQGYDVAVLNMASRSNPGGGVLKGAGAQEETLFRRTNLFQSLYQFAPFAGRYEVPLSDKQYPMDRNYGGIYTPDATVFRKDEKSGYELMTQPVNLSFISVAGINRPELTSDGMIAEHLIEPTRRKMRTIFRIGLRHGHDTLVLGALGCGAFANPPRHIARLFHEVMNEEEFRNKYRLIVFAVLDDHNSHRPHNPEGNFVPFYNEFIQNVNDR